MGFTRRRCVVRPPADLLERSARILRFLWLLPCCRCFRMGGRSSRPAEAEATDELNESAATRVDRMTEAQLFEFKEAFVRVLTNMLAPALTLAAWLT